jgi:hypothetical protein
MPQGLWRQAWSSSVGQWAQGWGVAQTGNPWYYYAQQQ